MTQPQHETISKAIVDRLFEDMQNPEYQGHAFTWEGFANFVQRRVEGDLFLYYGEPPKDFEQIKSLAGQHAHAYATALVEANKDTLVVFARKGSPS